MSLFTEDMRMITAVVIEEKSDAVVKSLLQLGALDFVQINNLPPEQLARLSRKRPNTNRIGIEDTRHRIDNLLRQGKRPLPTHSMLDVKNMVDLDLRQYINFLNKFSASLSTLKDQQKSYSQKLEALDEMKKYLHEGKREYLDIRTGTISGDISKLRQRLDEFGALIIEHNNVISTMTLTRDSGNVSQVLTMLKWVESDDTEIQKKGSIAVSNTLNEEIEKCIQKKEDLEYEVAKKIQEKETTLLEMWCNLRLHELSDQIRSFFKYTKNTTLFSGWVPSHQSNDVESAIYNATEGQCIIDWTEVNEVDKSKVPVAVKSPKLLKPFENIVKNYGIPEYGTINPTGFVAVAYLSMFALMFADVGQGFVLFLVGLFMHLGYKKNPMKKDGMINRGVAVLLLYLGVASMIGGWLFGSTFGFKIIPALWFNYHSVVNGEAAIGTSVQNVYDILGITIFYGIGVIFVGLIINWINLFRKKHFIELLLSRTGITGAAMYIAGLAIAMGYVKSDYKSFPSETWISIVLVVGALCLLAKEPLEYLVKKRNGETTEAFSSVMVSALLLWPIELLETFTGYMSNTLSFLRVAGLGIAHVSLMGAFEQLAEMPGKATVGGIAILLAGNVLVIALEGLSAGIQALRLNYYEFFTKFFNGTGIAYSPVSLRSSDR